MIGFCGINCSECRAHRATVAGDEKLLRGIADQPWGGPFKPEEWVCLGCGPDNTEFLSGYCLKCEIRKCALAKGLRNCAACSDFEGCGRLHDFIKKESEHLPRMMGWLRARYLSARGEA